MSEYKYIIFFTMLLVGVPVSCILAFASKFYERIILLILVFFTCRNQETINFISFEEYRGSSRGYEVSIVDLMLLILFFVVVFNRRRYKKVTVLPPGSLIYFIYFVISLLSFTQADILVYSGFEITKMARMYMCYWIMVNWFQNDDNIEFFVRVIPFVIIYIFGYTFMQKYSWGIYQCYGPLPHQNSLVMYMIMFNGLIFSKLMNRKNHQIEDIFILGVFCLGSLCVMFTLSRAGLLCYAISLISIFLLSFLSQFTPKKIVLTLLLTAGGVVVIGFAMKTLIQRYSRAPPQSLHTRKALAIAAVNMANSGPLGVGLNNFGLKVNPPYEYALHIDRTKYFYEEGIVETVYLLIAAETGWFNLLVFLCFLLSFYARNLLNIIRYRGTQLQYVAMGMAGALTGVYIESLLEWVLKQTSNFYQLMILFALISAMMISWRDKCREQKLQAKKKKQADMETDATIDDRPVEASA
jgi:O-antigen ligase